MRTEEEKKKRRDYKKIYRKNWTKEQREKRNKYQREWEKKEKKRNPWINSFRASKSRCSSKYGCYYSKGRRCYITRKEVKALWFRDKAYLMKKPSIDRIDNDGDYTFKNCRFIEIADNVRRGAKISAKVRSTSVHQINSSGKIVNTFSSYIQAERSTGILSRGIGKTVRGEQQTSGGFQWKATNITEG